ncbi:hypothetical protein ACJBU6_00418 [Exserohilum turcicum]
MAVWTRLIWLEPRRLAGGLQRSSALVPFWSGSDAPLPPPSQRPPHFVVLVSTRLFVYPIPSPSCCHNGRLLPDPPLWLESHMHSRAFWPRLSLPSAAVQRATHAR